MIRHMTNMIINHVVVPQAHQCDWTGLCNLTRLCDVDAFAELLSESSNDQ